MSKICCGGFELGEGLELDGKILKVSGGESLPEVTAEDNGDVLTVVDGAWAKAAPSGSFIANAVIGFNEDSEDTPLEVISVDKTPTEVAAAYASGTNVIFNVSFSADGEITTSGCVPITLATKWNGVPTVGTQLGLLVKILDAGEGSEVLLGQEAEGNVFWGVTSF